MKIRTATPSEHAEVLSILDAAALQTDSEQTKQAIDRRNVFVAVSERTQERGEGSPPILGALILDTSIIEAIAVRPGRRGQGIGRALVERAQRSRERLVADCAPGVRAFWDALGFDITERDSGRLEGVWCAG